MVGSIFRLKFAFEYCTTKYDNIPQNDDIFCGFSNVVTEITSSVSLVSFCSERK